MRVSDQLDRIDSARVRSRAGTRIALLGLGRVGSAVARLAARPDAAPGIHLLGALVRDTAGRGPVGCPITTDATSLLDANPEVVVEVLGGIDPARGLVLAALSRGIPVVSANKTLIAAYGDELRAAAGQSGTSLRYEAAVIAGVPFLGTLGRRPLAGSIGRIHAILNGTTNFVLSELDAGAAGIDVALADARHRGFAESDPSKDVNGTDAAEKLSILVRHLGGLTLAPSDIPTRGIGDLTGADLHHARMLGGALKPVAAAAWVDDCVTAFVGPAFVPGTHPLAGLSGAENGIRVHGHHLPPVFFSGAGAGPDATAATILDDVVEATGCGGRGTTCRSSGWSSRTGRPSRLTANRAASWFVRLRSGATLPPATEIAGLFAGYRVWIRRSSDVDRRGSVETVWLLTHPCDAGCTDAALAALSSAFGCSTFRWPSLEDEHD